MVVMKLLQESVAFALQQLRGDKFRTFLSLLGVSIGIFSIVAVFTAIDALKRNVKEGFDAFGSDLIMVDQWPLTGEDEMGNSDMTAEYKWWEYLKRPTPSYEEYRFIKENATKVRAVSLYVSFNKTVKYNRNSIPDCQIAAVSQDWEKVSNVDMLMGRCFSESEINAGTAVCILGYEVWQELFNGSDPIGDRVKVGGRDLSVIGVFDKQGESMVNIGGGTDGSVYIPINVARYMTNLKRTGGTIMVRPLDGIPEQDVTDELTLLMRACRRLSPGEKNNFSVNKMTMLLDMVAGVFSMVNTVGWVIAGFSLLIGGFGIANIMFVSVKERTNIIGIQKALGAKKYIILTQFLAESVFLAIAGGLVGILLVLVIILLIPDTGMFVVTLSPGNILSGLLIASAIGIISGMAPAWAAANLNPVDAINAK